MDNTIEIVEVTKSYELRSLVATDMGTICKIITAIGFRQFKDCFNVKGLKEGEDVEEVGIGIMFDIAGIIMSNFDKAEEPIQNFLASLTGMKLSEIKKLSLADYGELIIEVVTKEEFKDFFGRVMKLLNH